MSDIQHIESHTPDLTEENVDKLAALFPDVLTEITDPQTGETKRAIDFDALRDKLGDVAESTRERYQFTWPGKRAAKAEARKPISKTLRPVKERSKDWDTTQNLYIEGDNLDALKILRETYAGKIKLIYIDPPYNTGHDFIYKDNFGKTVAADKAESGDWDDEGGQLVANPESNGRFHSDWCSMIYPRLLLARDLLTSDGVIFISIDDNEQANLRKISDDVFGEDNFLCCVCVNRPSEIAANFTISKHEYLLVYVKSAVRFTLQAKVKYTISRGTVGNIKQTMPIIEFPAGLSCYGIEDGIYQSTRKIEDSLENIENLDPIIVKGGKLAEPVRMKARWRSSNDMRNFFANNCKPTKAKINGELVDIYFENDRFNPQIKKKTFEKIPSLFLNNKRGGDELQQLGLKQYFDFPKSSTLMQFVVGFTNKDDIILDFFSGSGTMAHAVMKQNSEDGGNRKFIMVQIPEGIDETVKNNELHFNTLCEVGEERICRAGEQIKAEVEAENAQGRLDGEVKQVPDIGFRVLRVDSSSYEDVRKTPAEFSQGALDLDVDHTKEGRSSLDLLFECLPSFQLPYTSSIETLSGEPFDGYTVYSVNGGQLLACFDADIPESLIRDMAGFDPKPSYVVVAEKSLPDSAARTNFAEIFRQSANALDGQTQIRII